MSLREYDSLHECYVAKAAYRTDKPQFQEDNLHSFSRPYYTSWSTKGVNPNHAPPCDIDANAFWDVGGLAASLSHTPICGRTFLTTQPPPAGAPRNPTNSFLNATMARKIFR